MPKKSAKFDRNVNLPDWADDVTPTEEVMKKFYAPTGAFRSGPISVPEPFPAAPLYAPEIKSDSAADSTLSDVETDNETDETTVPASNPKASGSERQKPHAAPPATATLTPPVQSRRATGGDNLLRKPKSSARFAEQRPVPFSESTERKPPANLTTPDADAFDYFASKWRRYLYPGQLAVMRVLLELTATDGERRCFTRYSEIASATKMSRRNIINVINSLADRGFIERLEVKNTATAKGILLKVHLEPAS